MYYVYIYNKPTHQSNFNVLYLYEMANAARVIAKMYWHYVCIRTCTCNIRNNIAEADSSLISSMDGNSKYM